MDATVDDFFNEINQLSATEAIPKSTAEVDWQECLDPQTGYTYFWNTQSDEVTWVPPKIYQPLDKAKDNNKADTVRPPAPAPDPPKIDSETNGSLQKKPVEKAPNKPVESESEDEKIELITEYGGEDSESETEEDKPSNEANLQTELVTESTTQENLNSEPSNEIHSQTDDVEEEDEDDENIDLLQTIQNRAQELKQLGGEIPLEVKKVIEEAEVAPKTVAFSLVAGYNSESDSESEEIPTLPPPETSHSTLFPIAKPIDIKDFEIPLTEPANENNFHNKAFQRKRRIGISLVNTATKRSKDDGETEFTGLGFKSDDLEEKNVDKPTYGSFQKGGVMFVKADVLNPTKDEDSTEVEDVDRKVTEADYQVLREKLSFLGEGRPAVLPVQTMLIQAETLFVAMKEGGLKLSYLFKWLKDMCSELVKLEREAAPEGWLLQWDRSHKRYFYQNQLTKVTQWHYPEPDVMRCDDAMDISTTPPPPEIRDEIGPSLEFGPQLPARTQSSRSPTPPPPPIISIDMGLGPVIPIHAVYPPLPIHPTGFESSDKLSTALDSFYSEIAEVSENGNSQPPDAASNSAETTGNVESGKKKKKKVKLSQGLTMKKKGVSQLVEKWKNVQKTYGD